MASHVYPKAKEAFISTGIDLTSATVKIVLLTSAYTYSASHQFYSDLSGVIVASGALASKTVALGVFDAADVTLTAVASGSTITALAGYKDTGTTTTSQLLWFNDGFSSATTGGDVTVQWDSGTSKIFAL
jgi:hypothetical protein